MRNLLSMMLVVALVPAAAGALSAQQPQNPSTAHATKTTTHHTRKHTKRHTTSTHHARTTAQRTATRRHHARTSMHMRHMNGSTAMSSTMSSSYTAPTVLGRPVTLPGISAGLPVTSSSPSVNNPSGISRAGRLQRLANGLITPDAARTIALRRVSGGTSVDKIRLRTDNGRRVYDVKVVTPNQTGNEMVRVDAHTGAVIETKNVDNPVGTVKGALNHAVNQVKHH